MSRRLQNSKYWILIILGFFLSSFLSITPVIADDPFYDCQSILIEAAMNAGVQGELTIIQNYRFDQLTIIRECGIFYTIHTDPASDDGTFDSSIPHRLTQTYLRLSEYDISSESTLKLSPPFVYTKIHDGFSFKGYPAFEYNETNYLHSIEWWMIRGDRGYWLQVETTGSIFNPANDFPAENPLPIAQALAVVAERQLPQSTQNNINPANNPPTIDDQPNDPDIPPTDQVTEPPETEFSPTELEISPETDQVILENPDPADTNTFQFPILISLGNLFVPVIGALSGAITATILSLISINKKPAVVLNPDPNNDYIVNPQVELFPSQPVYSKQGTTEIEIGEPIDIHRLLKAQLSQINQELLDQNIYVKNPLQGDPTLIFDGLTKVSSWVWDNSAGWVTKSQGLTCDQYVDKTFSKVKSVIEDQFGQEAQVQSVIFEEKSSVSGGNSPIPIINFINFLDRLVDDNHNLIKVTLPDGSEWAVDFHAHNHGDRPPILRPWNEVKKIWKKYMGEEFTERIIIY